MNWAFWEIAFRWFRPDPWKKAQVENDNEDEDDSRNRFLNRALCYSLFSMLYPLSSRPVRAIPCKL